LSPSLFVVRLKKEFSSIDFSVKSKSGVPVLYAGKKRIDVKFTEEELIGLAVAAGASNDDVIEMFYNVIRKRIIEEVKTK